MLEEAEAVAKPKKVRNRISIYSMLSNLGTRANEQGDIQEGMGGTAGSTERTVPSFNKVVTDEN